ncbi:MAG: hypothetical protein IKR52_08980 [Paludibacteraceae bacterium]|nr:hypothetical protein [Paludibacteraceae bacterium]
MRLENNGKSRTDDVYIVPVKRRSPVLPSDTPKWESCDVRIVEPHYMWLNGR